MVMRSNKGSVYSKLPGLSEVNQGQGTEGGTVKSTLRSLGFDEGQSLLAPKDDGPKRQSPPPKIDTGRSQSVAQTKVQLLVQKYGQTVEGLARGLGDMGFMGDDALLDELGKLVGTQTVVKARLSQHLVQSGRSNQLGKKQGGKLGGKRSKESDERAEGMAGKVLTGMERSTRENQEMTNKRLGEDRPLTHAVSGHGKGTDQISRLTHGRRNDELQEDKSRPSTSKTLTGNQHGLQDTTTPEYTTVGNDPNNKSGAFTTNLGMLHVVNEAFAQAGMVESYGRGERQKGDKSVDVDRRRFDTTVKGHGEELGYNVEVVGRSSQTSGTQLSKDEIEERFKSIKHTGKQMNSTVVLDPAFNDKGQRVGWNLQTAYANNDTPEEGYAKPEDVGGKRHDVEARVDVTTRSTKDKKGALDDAKKELDKARGALKGKQGGLKAKPGSIAKAKKELEDAKRETPPLAPEKLKVFEDKVKQHEDDVVELTKQIEELEKQLPLLEQKVTLAKAELEDSQKKEKKALEDKKKLPKPVQQGGGGGKAPKGGYDPKTGLWIGGRPDKPSDSSSIKGEDNGKSLTAHHLYPWNKIESDLNRALGAKDKAGLQKLFLFGEVTDVPSSFWDELAKPPGERGYAFAEVLNHAVPKICWSPSNIFMGPSERGDDPGEDVDTAYTKSGLPSPSSALAELLKKSGGIGGGGPGSKLTQILLTNSRDNGEPSVARKFDSTEWGKDKDGKPIRVNPNAFKRDESGKPELDSKKKPISVPERTWKKNDLGKPVLGAR
ncbi:MAG: hypothetical protein IT385_06180 [Deltaproteobacteria bacterium]|nr:hypothetical protein [Deltaproteobacteria bacterium]